MKLGLDQIGSDALDAVEKVMTCKDSPFRPEVMRPPSDTEDRLTNKIIGDLRGKIPNLTKVNFDAPREASIQINYFSLRIRLTQLYKVLFSHSIGSLDSLGT